MNLETTLALLVQSIAANDEEAGLAALVGLAGHALRQLERTADALEKLAGVMDALPPAAPPPPPGEPSGPVVDRSNCSYLPVGCPAPDLCHHNGECLHPAGFTAA